MEEIWKDIKCYEGHYQVSNLGRVKSLGRYRKGRYGSKVWVNERFMYQNVQKSGYVHIHLSMNHKVRIFKLHRLVAEAFIPNPNNLPQINHKDENKQNNCVDNLEWCDSKYNNNYGTKIERYSKTTTNDKKRSKQVLQYDLDGNLVREWPSLHEIERELGCSRSNVAKSCKSEGHHKVKGFIFRFKQ